MGASRRNVQRIINDLEGAGLVAFETNPHHRRAQLVVLTSTGKKTMDAAMRLEAPWVNSFSEGLSVKEIETAHRIVMAFRQNLDGGSA
jgi:DNA-binding MarR family transcriptional regulator